MLLRLMKRDLKLHWDALLVPILLLALEMVAVGLAADPEGLEGLILETSFLVPVLPLAIHLREDSQGTLGDLLVLPVSRNDVVRLRYLQVLLFSTGMLALAHLGMWVALSLAANSPIPPGVMSGHQLLGTGLFLLFWFAYPMPFFLRWGLKGIAFAYVPAYVLFTILVLKVPDPIARMHQFVEQLLAYPGPMALVIPALFLLSFGLSLKAFAGRDI